MTAEGASLEDIARTVNDNRNQSRINARIGLYDEYFDTYQEEFVCYGICLIKEAILYM